MASPRPFHALGFLQHRLVWSAASAHRAHRQQHWAEVMVVLASKGQTSLCRTGDFSVFVNLRTWHWAALRCIRLFAARIGLTSRLGTQRPQTTTLSWSYGCLHQQRINIIIIRTGGPRCLCRPKDLTLSLPPRDWGKGELSGVECLNHSPGFRFEF